MAVQRTTDTTAKALTSVCRGQRPASTSPHKRSFERYFFLDLVLVHAKLLLVRPLDPVVPAVYVLVIARGRTRPKVIPEPALVLSFNLLSR